MDRPLTISWRNVGLAVLVVCALLHASGVINLWPEPGLRQVALQVASVERRAEFPNYSAPIVLEARFERVQKFTIQFDGLAIDDIYDNFFQTDDDFGVRLELQQPNQLYLGVGNRIVLLDSKFELERWHRFRIHAEHNKLFTVEIDGNVVFSSDEPRTVFAEYRFRNVVLGTGFSEQRPLQGAIRNFVLHAEVVPVDHRYTALRAVIFFIVAGFAAMAFWPTLARPAILAQSVTRLFAALVLIGPLLLYQFLYTNAFYPITEGWFTQYASLIRLGHIPYTDFPLLLPPLYPLTIAAFQTLLGPALAPLHYLGIVVTCLIGIAVFALLRGGFSELVSAFAAAIATIYYQSGVAYIGYDFTQFVTLYLLLAGLSIAIYARRVAAGATDWRNQLLCFASGVAMACAVLTKHSNGGVCSIILVVASVVIMVRFGNWKVRLAELAWMIVGGLLPMSIVIGWLAYNGALSAFLENVFVDAAAAKGGGATIVANAFAPFLGGGTSLIKSIAPLALGVGIAAVAFLSSVIVGFLLFRHAGERYSLQSAMHRIRDLCAETRTDGASARFFVVIAGALCAIVLLAFLGNCAVCRSVESRGYAVTNLVVLTAVNVYIIGTVVALSLALVRRSPVAAYWFVVFSLGLGLTLGNGTSGGVDELASFLGLAIVVAALMWSGLSFTAPALLPASIALALAAVLVNAKFDNPYSWWGVSVGDVRKTECARAEGILAHLCVRQEDNEAISKIVALAREHSRPDQAIYVFPHVPIFYALADRLPFKGAVASWPDFMSDRTAVALASDLIKETPPVLIVADLPDFALTAHERLFRGGQEAGQRAIMRSISWLENSGQIVPAYFAANVSGIRIKVYIHKK